MSEPIYQVDEVRARMLDGDTLKVNTRGQANSAGWDNVRLEPRIYIDPPQDGVQEFDLVGDPPSGPVADVMTEVKAKVEMPRPDWATGVRVHAKTNSIEEPIAGA